MSVRGSSRYFCTGSVVSRILESWGPRSLSLSSRVLMTSSTLSRSTSRSSTSWFSSFLVTSSHCSRASRWACGSVLVTSELEISSGAWE